MEPAHVGQAGAGVAPNRDQLRRDRNRNLLRSDGADIESDGRVHALEQMRGHAFLLQRLKNLDHLALRSDHADVAGASLHRPAQDAHVVAVAAGDDDDAGSLVRIELLDSFIEIERMNFASGRKAFFRGVGGAVVRDDEVKPCISGDLTKVYRNVTCTEYIK